MNIKTGNSYIAAVHPQVESNIAEFVKSGDHKIALTGEISRAVGLSSAIGVQVDADTKLKAVPNDSKKLTADQRLRMEKAALTLGTATLPLIKKYLPQASGPIEGIEFVFATKTAFDAWADPERKSVVKPLIKTTRAMFELVDIAQSAFPVLAGNPYFEAVGVFVKVGDSVYQFYTDVAEPAVASTLK